MIQIGTLSVDFEQRDIRRQGASLRIGARALDILEVLHRASAVVSKDDIMDAVWPGLIVEENRLQVHVATLRKALGTSRDLIKTVPGRGYLLVACASPGRNRCPRPTRRPPSRLPYRPMPTRRRCLRRSSDATPKSRRSSRCSNARRSSRSSARAGSARRASPYAWPTRCSARASVLFVELARAGTRADMLIAVAAELGLDAARARHRGHRRRIRGVALPARVRQCRAHRRPRREPRRNADVVRRLAARTRDEPRAAAYLGRSGAAHGPLVVPDDDARNDEIVRCSAVELFLERVRTAAPDCPVDEAGMRLIADICRRLDGLPLAIELAAARVATLSRSSRRGWTTG